LAQSCSLKTENPQKADKSSKGGQEKQKSKIPKKGFFVLAELLFPLLPEEGIKGWWEICEYSWFLITH